MIQFALALFLGLFSFDIYAGISSFSDRQLFIDGQPQPQIFGAELQYFRMRGGIGPNIPRSEVLALWNKALDRMVEAHMNAVSFYIPWDFHEYKEGHFDFDGTVDEDGDGRPDYPSRDVKTFIKMILAKGIHIIMVRPGPYINAEWGFLNFGAIPLWFHEKFPESHMHNSQGERTLLYDYFDPDFRRYTKLWFSRVYTDVLKPYIGPEKPIQFLQLDNETNYMWQSLYNHDYGPLAVSRYQNYLQKKYVTLNQVNIVHQKNWKTWSEIKPATVPGLNGYEDQDWYDFEDHSMFEYLQFVRTTWENLGVREPEVIFTLAESYNAAKFGALPNYLYRNHPTTGMMTVNLYPKTWESSDHPLMNSPFKADHDVKAADAGNDLYFGKKVEWAMGPEIQGGWWAGVPVSLLSRQQTYLTTLGHGLKGLFIYYFIEGQNWQNDWIVKQIQPYYERLKESPSYKNLAILPEDFWVELQGIFDQKVLAGVRVKDVMLSGPTMGSELYFDSPLNKDAEARPQFQTIVKIGEKIVSEYGQWLGSAIANEDDICIIKDSESHKPSLYIGLDTGLMNGEWSGGLVGFLEHRGINPKIIHLDITSLQEMNSCRLLFYQDSGREVPELAKNLARLAKLGATVVSLMGSKMSELADTDIRSHSLGHLSGVNWVSSFEGMISVPDPIFALDAFPENCRSILTWQGQTVAVQCPLGNGQWVQMGAAVHAFYNSTGYFHLTDLQSRRSFLENLIKDISTHLLLIENDAIVAFSRTNKDGHLWITVKNGKDNEGSARILIKEVSREKKYRVKNLWTGDIAIYEGQKLQQQGLFIRLPAFESTVYVVEVF